MGRDKAFLPWRSGTLLSHALDVTRSIVTNVSIVGDKGKFADFAPVIEDCYRGRGPLGGIHSALAGSSAAFNLMLAVDLPFVEGNFLQYLVSEARQTQAAVTVPRIGGRWQPLCAIYRQSFLPVAEKALQERKNKIDPLFAEVEARVLEAEELFRAGFSGRIFRNLNTPQDWKDAEQEVADGKEGS